MKKGKVVSVKGDGTFKDLYKFEVELDNGDNGVMYKRTPQHWLEEGQDINYTINDKGTLKVIREGWDNPPSSNGSPSFKKDNSVQKYIIKQSSLKASVDLCCSKGIHNKEDVVAIAQYFTDWVLGKQEEKENLPFS